VIRRGGAPISWPEGRRAAVSITFDNLGEAAEIELGIRPEEPLGGHYSVTNCLPIVLELLGEADVPATFFVEGLNAGVYPEELKQISAAGHEIAYHAWRHEDWSSLAPTEERENLARGSAALRSLGLEPAGFRPPGGLLNEATTAYLRDGGFDYCSPAGSQAGVDELVVLPFAWPAVDAYHVLPTFGALRRHFSGSDEPGGPDAVRGSLLGAVDDAVADGGHVSLVLHTWLIELELDAVREILGRVRSGADQEELWACRCDDAAGWISSHPHHFAGPPRLDRTSWMRPA
jgi:peptidoglycan/xylan/chitin deacetylase (PgdA/CDA1 family)